MVVEEGDVDGKEEDSVQSFSRVKGAILTTRRTHLCPTRIELSECRVGGSA
jgi:hypothetical protein